MTKVPADPRLCAMMDARDRILTEIDAIEGSIRREAESTVRNAEDLPETFGRHATDWTEQHETSYRSLLIDIGARRRNETGALQAKVMRQSDAIRAAITRLHVKKPRPRRASPND